MMIGLTVQGGGGLLGSLWMKYPTGPAPCIEPGLGVQPPPLPPPLVVRDGQLTGIGLACFQTSVAPAKPPKLAVALCPFTVTVNPILAWQPPGPQLAVPPAKAPVQLVPTPAAADCPVAVLM